MWQMVLVLLLSLLLAGLAESVMALILIHARPQGIFRDSK
jgi:hypothetical protein